MALTREALLKGAIPDMIRKLAPELAGLITTDEWRAANIAALMATRPHPIGEGVLVFGFGSLLFNPAIVTIGEVKPALINGWRRSFCLASNARGTDDTPGMMLALEPGGSVSGGIMRIAEDAAALELDLLWRREMVVGSYVPCWLPVADPVTGESLGSALAFTMNTEHPTYCCELSEEELVRRLAHGVGKLGRASEYLFGTRDSLRKLGAATVCPYLERLGDAVEAEQARAGAVSATFAPAAAQTSPAAPVEEVAGGASGGAGAAASSATEY